MNDDLLRCAAGNREFAIRAHEVRHVARADQLRHDEVNDGRVGAVKLGGQQVPVFSMSRVLGLSGDEERVQGDQHIAVTGDPQELVGWLVDRLVREPAHQVRISALPAFIGGQARRWFCGVVTGPDREPILLIDPRRLNPLSDNTVTTDDPLDTFTPVAGIAGTKAEPVALVFSTAALPPSTASRYALSGRQVAAIVQPSDPITVPGCAAHVAGLTLWRDVVVPILDYRSERRTDGANRRRLIARCSTSGKHALVAFAIDPEVVMHRPVIDNRLMPGIPCPPFAHGVFEVDGDQVVLLDLDALVAGAA
jgi:chemotaxis signal transduction protein